ncbi:hypothetical protein D3C79_1015390 [compost metagenome]
MAFDLQICCLGRAAQALIFLIQPSDRDTLFAQAIEVAVQLAQQSSGRGRAAVVRFLPLLTQANGFADSASEYLGFVALVFQLLDVALDFGEGGTHRRTDGAADHKP